MKTEAFRQFIVPKEYQGLRIDAVLAKIVPEFSRSQLCSWLQEDKIKVDAKSMKPKSRVFGGEQIDFLVDLLALANKLPQCEPENIPLSVLFEDEDIIVINKPAGLVVHPGAGNPKHTLVNALLYHAPSLAQLPRAGIVHRLDKETTGLLVVAKTLQSQTHLSRQIQERSMQRRYLTLVHGHLISGGEIKTCYGRHPRSRLKMAVTREGREAITRYLPIKRYQDFTLLEVQLLTGRTHQIRVHMAHISHPVVGDPLYSGRRQHPKNAPNELLELFHNFKRQALHAFQLRFIHPTSQAEVAFEAAMPADLQTLVTAFDGFYLGPKLQK